MTDPRYAPTTGSPDPVPVDESPNPDDAPDRTETDTHTAALQGAAAGGALSGNAGYAGGLLTGSEDGIGIREIPDEEPVASD